jgi:cytochrome c peroxidase
MQNLRRFYPIVSVFFFLLCLLSSLFLLFFFFNNQSETGVLKARVLENDWSKAALERSLTQQLGLPLVVHPKDNLPTQAKIELGRKLFFDRRLSINGTTSCGMCHVPEQGFTSHEIETSVGVEGRIGRRNTPSILNSAYYKHLFVDGRDPSLETQYISPLIARNEMANPSAGHVIALLKKLPDYQGLFEKAFSAPPSLDTVGKAFAVYQRSLIAGNSRFDRWLYGKEKGILDQSEVRGYQIFSSKGGCVSCHLIGDKYAKFTDDEFHDISYGWWREQQRQNPPKMIRVELAPGVFYDVSEDIIAKVSEKIPADLGRYEVTENPKDRWKFRTPTLRNLSITAPYMHDGKFATIKDVLKFYNQGGEPHKEVDPRIKPLGLSSEEMQDLENFLKSLTSPFIKKIIEEARSQAPDNY